MWGFPLRKITHHCPHTTLTSEHQRALRGGAINSLLQWCISDSCNKCLVTESPSKLGQIADSSNGPWIETVLHIVLKFQVDCTCLE